MKWSVPTCLAALLAPAVVSANGGPYDGSRILGPGSVEFCGAEEIELLSEDLSMAVGPDSVIVDVTYVLDNPGPAMEIDFAFPVDFASADEPIGWHFEEDGRASDEVSGFTISLDEYELETETSIEAGTGEFVEDEYTYTVDTYWFTTSFTLGGSSADTLRVHYSFEPGFSDWENSKRWFPSWNTRHLTYRLDPAGNWGDGIVDRFSYRIDFSELVETHESIEELPQDGYWITPTEYGFYGTSVDLRDAEPLELAFEVDNAKMTQFALEHLIGLEDISEVRASSELAPQGGSTYEVSNLFDLDFDTAWSPGEDSSGVGAWIEIRLDDCEVGAVLLVNGYMKSEEAYTSNSRIRSLRLTAFEGAVNHPLEIETPWFEDVIELEDSDWIELDMDDFAARMQMLYDFGEGENLSAIRIEILEVYPGTTFDDLCATELVITGYGKGDPAPW